MTQAIQLNEVATGDAAHAAAMIAKVDANDTATAAAVATPATPLVDATRPAWLPAKFKDEAAFAASYAELEAKQSKGAKPDEAPAATPAGLDMEAFVQEYSEKGELSAESFKALEEKAGIPRHLVEAHIAGQVALAESFVTAAHTAAGSSAAYAETVAWAKTGVDAATISAYNDTIATGNHAEIAEAVKGLRSKFELARGQEPTLLSGNSTGVSDAFASMNEVSAAMKDKRYGSDPAYTNAVIQKLDRSQFK